MRCVIIISVLLMVNFTGAAQVQVGIKEGNRIKSPEIFFTLSLHDTIFAMHEGIAIKNYASVKFDVDEKGNVDNIGFSVTTDSLVIPHILNVLAATNHKWIIKRNGKQIKSKANIVLPIIFYLRPQVVKKRSTRSHEILGQITEDIEFEGMNIFHFSNNKEEDLFVYQKNGLKYEGIVLSPIKIKVPRDPDLNNY